MAQSRRRVAGETARRAEAAEAASEDWVVLGEAPAAAAEAAAGEAAAAPAAAAAAPSAAPAEGEPKPELDLCFMCDCTGSMGRYILAAQQNIESIVKRIAKESAADVRFALVSYRDHPPQDRSYVTQIFDFTGSVEEMLGYVNTMKAAGGGDGPEAVTAALSDALGLPWRANATKVSVLIADAPPHGLEPSGDGFPNGDPEGRDPLDIARQMAALSITCYSVGVEPVLGQYRFARDFMCTVAEITGGQAVALSSAALLADVIVNGSSEEISLTKLERQVEEEVQSVQKAAAAAKEAVSKEELHKRACSNLQKRGMMSVQMDTDGGMKNSAPSIWHKSAKKQTLAEAKRELVALSPEKLDSQSARLDSMAMSRSMRTRGGYAASVARGGIMRKAKKCLLRSSEVEDALDDEDECLGAAPRAAALPMAPATESSKASSYNRRKEAAITVDQVSRIMNRKTAA